MLFWIAATLIALGVAAMLLGPLIRQRPAAPQPGTEGNGDSATEGKAPAAPRPGSDLAIYRDQLAAIGGDLARGTIDEAEAARLRTEISRRILAADRAGRAGGTGGADGGVDGGADGAAPAAAGRAIAGFGALLVVGGALGGYLYLGQPGYPDLPLGGRMAQAAERLATLPAQAEAEALVADAIAANLITPPEEIAATVARLREETAADPGLTGELALLRDFEAGVRNYPEAARLSARINAAAGEAVTPDDLVTEVELMLFATGGTVSAEAAALIDRLGQVAPDHPGAIFLRGYLLSQVGRPDLAFALWRPLAEGPQDSPFGARARAVVGSAAAAAGIDYALPDSAPAGSAPAAVTPEAIRSMVEGLSARLASDGGTAEEWARLIRSLMVLGETDRARAILDEARGAFANDPGLTLIEEAAASAAPAPTQAPDPALSPAPVAP